MIIYNPIQVLPIFGFKIYTWGIFFALSFLISTFLASNYAKKKGKNPEVVYGVAFYSLMGGIVGARLLYVVLNFNQFNSLFDVVNLTQGGLVSYGGLLGAVVSLYLYFKRNKLNFLEYFNLLAPYVALGFAIARVGCFLNWDDFGVESNLPWAVKVDFGRHPTQLYHTFFDLIIFFVLLKLRKSEKYNKNLFFIFLILYGIFRIFVDFFRDYGEGNLRLLSQGSSVLIILVSLYFIRKNKKINL